MLNSIFEAENMRKFSLLIFVLCILISLKNQNAETKKGSSSISAYWSSSSWDLYPSMFLSIEDEEEGLPQRSLEYDFYRTSCPQAENIIREVIREIYKVRSSVAPEILRLAFHDCFIEVMIFLFYWISVCCSNWSECRLLLAFLLVFLFFLLCVPYTEINSLFLMDVMRIL